MGKKIFTFGFGDIEIEKVSADIKKEFDSQPVYYKNF